MLRLIAYKCITKCVQKVNQILLDLLNETFLINLVSRYNSDVALIVYFIEGSCLSTSLLCLVLG